MSNTKQERDRLVQRYRQGQKEKFFGAARSLCELSLALVGESVEWCQPGKDDEDLRLTVRLILRQAELLQEMAKNLGWDEYRTVSSMLDKTNVQLREAAEQEVVE